MTIRQNPHIVEQSSGAGGHLGVALDRREVVGERRVGLRPDHPGERVAVVLRGHLAAGGGSGRPGAAGNRNSARPAPPARRARRGRGQPAGGRVAVHQRVRQQARDQRAVVLERPPRVDRRGLAHLHAECRASLLHRRRHLDLQPVAVHGLQHRPPHQWRGRRRATGTARRCGRSRPRRPEPGRSRGAPRRTPPRPRRPSSSGQHPAGVGPGSETAPRPAVPDSSSAPAARGRPTGRPERLANRSMPNRSRCRNGTRRRPAEGRPQGRPDPAGVSTLEVEGAGSR